MKVVRHDPSAERPSDNPIFEGLVRTRSLAGPNDSPDATVTLVRFADGARNKWHTHTTDQLLYVTEGRGIVAGRDEEHHVGAGDLVHVPAGTVHWHGAEPGQDLAHLSIISPQAQTAIADA